MSPPRLPRLYGPEPEKARTALLGSATIAAGGESETAEENLAAIQADVASIAVDTGAITATTANTTAITAAIAAPPPSGRLITLPLTAGLAPMVAVGDCHEIRLMWNGGSGPSDAWTSPDGTIRLDTELTSGLAEGQSLLVGAVSKTANDGIAGGTVTYPLPQWQFSGTSLAWAWCSVH
jgi:hypothetical protein